MTSSEVPSRIAIKRPFAESGEVSTIADVAGNDINYLQGFPSVYSVPARNGGKYVKRGDINAIGKIATQDLFYHKCGGINTFDPEFAQKVGGYPKGAVLQFLNGTFLYDVISLHDNNMYDFTATSTIDNANWAYCNKEVAYSDRLLVFETNTFTVLTNASNTNTSFFSLGEFAMPKNGAVVLDVVSNVAKSGSPGGIFGIGIIAKEVTDSPITQLPTLANYSTQSWDLVYSNSFHPAEYVTGGSKVINAEYGKRYHFAYFAGSNIVTTSTSSTSAITSIESVKIYVS